MAHASLESAVQELRCVLTPNVQEQLVAGGEPGLTQLTLERWLKARKVGLLLLCVSGFLRAACSMLVHASVMPRHKAYLLNCYVADALAL
jgi:hypothetical protein